MFWIFTFEAGDDDQLAGYSQRGLGNGLAWRLVQIDEMPHLKESLKTNLVFVFTTDVKVTPPLELVYCAVKNLHGASVYAFLLYVLPAIKQTSGIKDTKGPWAP